MLDIFKMAIRMGGGLAALGAALLYSSINGWITLDFFSAIGPEQTYKAFVWCLLISFAAMVVLVLAHLHERKLPQNSVVATHDSIAVKNNSGTVNIKKGAN